MTALLSAELLSRLVGQLTGVSKMVETVTYVAYGSRQVIDGSLSRRSLPGQWTQGVTRFCLFL